ncbi:FAD-dependent oxidoreductase [Streptosporangium sp. NPDC000396]|uniref:FAD-dependent oxidoreductase n=1 Tax=Streptosporangium sp. NPDC000396 TaxID=3366185 RepID=UPI0036AFCA2F
MRVVVDLTRCQGYGQCVFAVPGIFAMRGQEALVYDPNPDDAERDRVQRAVEACPVRAIHVDGPVTHVAKGKRYARAVAQNGQGPRWEGRIVIVGASLAGLRAAMVLRREGFTGPLTLIGDEQHEPYDRPPLSKQVMAGQVPPDHTMLPHFGELDAEWLLGQRATGLDLPDRQVSLADGWQVGFDRLLIATGVRARPWFKPEEAALDGVFVLRTMEDAAGLPRRGRQRYRHRRRLRRR